MHHGCDNLIPFSGNQSYFSRLFKKETGLTPSAFRKKMQG